MLMVATTNGERRSPLRGTAKGITTPSGGRGYTEIEGSGFEDLQTKLVANFAWKKAHNQIHWLRS